MAAAARAGLLPTAYPGMRLTRKRLLNYWRSRYEMWRGVERVRAYPLVLTVEATNVCNLRCPQCFTGVGELGREKSMLHVEDFRRLIDELGDHLLQVEFYNWGEPLLNKRLPEMIRMAANRGVATVISSNLSFPMTDERAEEIVQSGLHVIGLSADGATQAVYEQYRVRGDLALVLENVDRLNAAKRRLGSSTPRIVYSYHLFAHNTHEVDAARALAREHEIEFSLMKGWVAGPDWDSEGRYNFGFHPSVGRCSYLWQQGVVHNDGGVAPCCATFYKEDDFAEVGTVDSADRRAFRDVWNNDAFRAARRMFANDPSHERRDLVCYDCPVTAVWRRYRAHVQAGKPASAFQLHAAYNDGWNYFFARRPARARPLEIIPLVEVHGARAGEPDPGARTGVTGPV